MRRSLLIPLSALALVHVVVLFAGFFAPYRPTTQHRSVPLAPPTRLHFLDTAGKFHLRPFVYRWLADPAREDYQEDRTQAYPVQFFVSGVPYRIAELWPARFHLFGVPEPATLFLIGTDRYGRDQWARFLYGGQISLVSGPLATLLALTLGVVLGTLSGYCGEWMDEVLTGAMDLFLALPWLYLLLGARALLPLNLAPAKAFLAIVGLLGVIGWARPARLVRNVVLSAKEREYVLAARGFGASDWYLLRRHVLPQARGVLLVHASLLIPHYILAEVTMSFLGLGVNEPATSWGGLLSSLQHFESLVFCWWMWLPVVFIFPVFLAYYSLGNALNQVNS